MSIHLRYLTACACMLAMTSFTAIAVDLETIRRQAAVAFDTVRRGDNGDSAQFRWLHRHADEAVDVIASYLCDNDERVRWNAITFLAATGGLKAASALIEALDDQSEDLQDRAAAAILTYVLRFGAAKLPTFSDKLIQGADRAPPGASALVLLGYVPEGAQILRYTLSERRWVRQLQWTLPVPAHLAARVALSRRGDNASRTWLVSKIQRGRHSEKLYDDAATLFLLNVINAIDTRDVLQALATASFTDEHRSDEGFSHDDPYRRIKDKAVHVFVTRLSLQPDFALNDYALYSPEQIEAVRKLVAETLKLQ